MQRVAVQSRRSVQNSFAGQPGNKLWLLGLKRLLAGKEWKKMCCQQRMRQHHSAHLIFLVRKSEFRKRKLNLVKLGGLSRQDHYKSRLHSEDKNRH